MKYKLGEIAKVLNGRAYKQNELLQKGKYKVLRVGNFFTSDKWYYSDLELDDDKYCENGDLLYAWSANFGPKIWNEDKTIYHYHIWKIIPDETIVLKEYLYYLLIKMTDSFKSAVHGSVMAHLTKSDMEHFELDIPNLNTQKKIVHILSALDQKIELNNKQNESLESLVSALYTEQFIKNKQSNWRVYSASDLFDYSSGYSYTSAELTEKSDLGMMTIKNFERAGGFKADGFKPLVPSKQKVPSANLFDIFISCTDVTQNADIIGNAIMLLDRGDYNSNTYSMDLVKIEPKINRFMVFAILKSKEFKNFALGYKSGTTVLHLNKKCLKEYKTSLPSDEQMGRFTLAAEKIFKKISVNLIENRNLNKLRDTLLPKLMSGEININEVTLQ